jgi:hypothetical protein
MNLPGRECAGIDMLISWIEIRKIDAKMNTSISVPETKNYLIPGFCLAGGLVYGAILGLISSSGLVLGLPTSLALEKRQSEKTDRSK